MSDLVSQMEAPLPPGLERKLPSSGTIKLSQIKTEFKKGNNLSAYLGAASGVPTKLPLKLTDFYGKEDVVPANNIQGNYWGPIDEEFSNGIAIYWILRKKGGGTANAPAYGGWWSATGQGKFPAIYAESQTIANNWITEFGKRAYFGLQGQYVSSNRNAGWAAITMQADNNRTSFMVTPTNISYANNQYAREYCDAIDSGNFAIMDWYD